MPLCFEEIGSEKTTLGVSDTNRGLAKPIVYASLVHETTISFRFIHEGRRIASLMHGFDKSDLSY